MENEVAKVMYSSRAKAAFDSRTLPTNGVSQIERIKEKAAYLWDELDSISIPPGNVEAGRLVASAKTRLEETVMWAVKGVSRS